MTKILIALSVILTFFMQLVIGAVLWPIFLISYVFFKTNRKNILYLSAFLLGIESDVLTGLPLGVSALILVMFACLLAISEIRFHKNIRVVILCGLITELCYFALFNLS